MAVVIAWRDLGCDHRRRHRQFVADRLRRDLPGVTIYFGNPEPFTRARGLNDAIRRADARVIVQCDPDSFIRKDTLLEAIELAREADGLVVPFDRFIYLSAVGTEEFYRYGCDEGELLALGRDETGYGGVGNVTVFSRRTWLRVGGYDERFGIWAGDDGAFRISSDALVAPMRRLEGPMFHLWHPRHPDSIPGSPGYASQMAILAEYRDSADDPAAIQAIIDRRRVLRAQELAGA